MCQTLGVDLLLIRNPIFCFINASMASLPFVMKAFLFHPPKCVQTASVKCQVRKMIDGCCSSVFYI